MKICLSFKNEKVFFSYAAIKKINLIYGQILTISVIGGGCSGFEYHFNLIEKKDDNFIFADKIIGVYSDNDQLITNTYNYKKDMDVLNKIAISNASIVFIKNSVINYKVDIMGSKFEVLNPNAVDNCSCGNSFDI